MSSMREMLFGSNLKYGLEIRALKEKSKNIEKIINQSEKDARKLSEQIIKYMTDNLTKIEKICTDHNYKKQINNLNEFQTSVLNDLNKFDEHDKAKIQDCFDIISQYHADIYTTKLNQFEKDVSDIESIVSKNKKQYDSYLPLIESQLNSSQARTEFLIQDQKKLL